MKHKTQVKKGFTLIELLVVVAVIGILASVILVGVGGFRARGRDSRRITDLRQVQNGLELYFQSNGTYPQRAGSCSATAWTTLANDLINANIGVNQVPQDPTAGASYCYGSASPWNRYVLGATLEDATNPALRDDVDNTLFGVNCGTPTGDTVYCITI